MDLSKCDAAKPDKTAEMTAKKLLEFLFEKMDLQDYLYHFTFTSDFAIARDIIKALEDEGSDLKIILTQAVRFLKPIYQNRFF